MPAPVSMTAFFYVAFYSRKLFFASVFVLFCIVDPIAHVLAAQLIYIQEVAGGFTDQ